MPKTGKAILVDTRPSKEVVVNSLTKDLTDEACIYDLIDNSVDAARNEMYGKLSKKETLDKLPESYSGYTVSLTLNGEYFSIEDNCGGIGIDKLQKMVLKFGQRSSHKMGIGLYGVGLNRALFKLGKVSHLKTDTGSERAELVLDVDKYLADPEWDLPAQAFSSTGEIGTKLEIRGLDADTARKFASVDFQGQLLAEIGKRYARFLKKGLSITLITRSGKTHAQPDEIEIREDGPYEPQYKSYKTPEGVFVHIACGQHIKHRFPAEQDHEKNPTELTAEYGWSVVCNDRAVLMADRSRKTGWEAKFHSEFYGFVGYVEFICDDPAKLPWNTAKTDVDLNNKAYQAALDEMRHFTEKWRSNALDAKKKKRNKVTLKARPTNPASPSTVSAPASVSAPAASMPAAASASTTAGVAPTIKPTIKSDQTQFFSILPPDVDEKFCNDKHLTLVHEAKTLALSSHGYAGLALIRMLFEVSAHTYFERHKKYDELKTYTISSRNAPRAKKGSALLTASEEKDLVPTLEEIFSYLEAHPQVWGTAKANHLKHSMTKMAGHKKTLNGVMHNAFQQVSNGTAFQIRDEVLPLLRHLIET